MWRAKAPDTTQVALLQRARERHDLHPLVIHDSYLINLASPPGEIRTKSIDGFAGEIERALVIGADYLVAHPGNYKGLTAEQGILNVAEAIALAWRSVPDERKRAARLTLLLENTAGAGCQLGGNLEELRTIREITSPYLGNPDWVLHRYVPLLRCRLGRRGRSGSRSIHNGGEIRFGTRKHSGYACE